MSVGARGQKQPALLVSVSVILFVASFVGWARQGDPPISANKHRTGGTLSAAAGAAPQDTEARDLKPIPLQQSAHHLIRGAAHPVRARVRCTVKLSSGVHSQFGVCAHTLSV